jgi:hypothetical protein
LGIPGKLAGDIYMIFPSFLEVLVDIYPRQFLNRILIGSVVSDEMEATMTKAPVAAKVIAVGTLLLAGYALLTSLPDIKRYNRISTM